MIPETSSKVNLILKPIFTKKKVRKAFTKIDTPFCTLCRKKMGHLSLRFVKCPRPKVSGDKIPSPVVYWGQPEHKEAIP